jgi:methionyl-tRNA formyltransferase
LSAHVEGPIRTCAILTSASSWFVPYARRLATVIQYRGLDCALFEKHTDLTEPRDVVFILSYFRLVPPGFLARNRHNLVVHESDLPKGKGWAPLFWQILEGKNSIPIVLFEATADVDSGIIYIKDTIELRGTELHDEIRRLQAEKTIEMCTRFLTEYSALVGKPQEGDSTFYEKRGPEDSELDLTKPLLDQVNLLRIANNDEFPAFFMYRGRKFILKVTAKDA